MPVVKVEIDGVVALTVQFVSVTVGNDGIDAQGCLVGHIEVERGDIDGYGDTDVVGVYIGLCGLLLRVADGFCASGQQPTANSQ